MSDGPASPGGGSHESGDHSPRSNVREQDRYLPIANISRIMKKALPANGKIAKDAKETVQECVSEFISFITSEASDKCQREKRKTINGDDLLWAMATLGFEDYIDPLKIYLGRYREVILIYKIWFNFCFFPSEQWLLSSLTKLSTVRFLLLCFWRVFLLVFTDWYFFTFDHGFYSWTDWECCRWRVIPRAQPRVEKHLARKIFNQVLMLSLLIKVLSHKMLVTQILRVNI